MVRWSGEQIAGSIAAYEAAAGVVFLQKPNSYTSGYVRCNSTDGIHRGTDEYRDRVIKPFCTSESGTVAWEAMLPPKYASCWKAMGELVEKIQSLSHKIEISWSPDLGISDTWKSRGKTFTGAPRLNPNPKPMYTATIMLRSKEYPQCWQGSVSATASSAPRAATIAAILAVREGT